VQRWSWEERETHQLEARGMWQEFSQHSSQHVLLHAQSPEGVVLVLHLILASPSELLASPSELLALPSELLAPPSELLASPSELLASPS
jgi:hypothetical protein